MKNRGYLVSIIGAASFVVFVAMNGNISLEFS